MPLAAEIQGDLTPERQSWVGLRMFRHRAPRRAIHTGTRFRTQGVPKKGSWWDKTICFQWRPMYNTSEETSK